VLEIAQRRKTKEKLMAFRQGNRNQMNMFPPTIEEYVAEDDPVRAYDAFVEALDVGEIGIETEEDKVGNPSYEPKAMLKLLVYGYSYGWRSSRKLERALHHNLSFMWLTGGLKPDHKTIANFRRDNKEAIKKVLKQCVKICIDLNLIEGNTLFVDSSAIRANASINKTWTDEKCQRELTRVDKRIEEILKECEQIDEKESGTLVKLSEELKDKEVLKERVKAVLEKIKEEGRKHINGTDEDSVKVKGRQGTHAGYKGQIVVDEKNGLIINSEAVNENSDKKQFTRQVKQANEVLGKKCKVACADAGYSDTEDLKETVDEEIRVVVPSQKQALHRPGPEDPFGKEKFRYDEKSNQYICPEGKVLTYSHYSKVKQHYLYRIKGPSNCIKCKHYGKCTNNKRGRCIIRLRNEKLKEELEAIYISEYGQAVYKKRKEKVELPFGHIKRNLNGGAFLLRGLKGTTAEMALFSTCFNISRMITILGMTKLMTKLYIKARANSR
jgi:transposase